MSQPTSQLTYSELDVLKTILRAHDLTGNKVLLSHLETFGAWVRENDQAKFSGNRAAQFPIAVLSLMGIHGGKAVG